MLQLLVTSVLTLALFAQGLFAQKHTEANIYKLLYSGQYDSVQTQLEEMAGTDSSDAEIYFLFGMNYMFQNNRSGALKSFKKSYDLYPGDIKNLYYYANSPTLFSHSSIQRY